MSKILCTVDDKKKKRMMKNAREKCERSGREHGDSSFRGIVWGLL